MEVNEDYIRERLTAYIYPRAPSTREQQNAFEDAVEAQIVYEEEHETLNMPSGVSSVSNDGVSVTFDANRAASAQYTAETICPAAYAYLFNAGLIRHSLPVARRL